MTSATSTKFLTVAEVADLLRVSKRSAYRIVKEMRPVQLDGATYVSADEFDLFVSSKMRGPRQSRERHAVPELLAARAAFACADLTPCCYDDDVVTYFVDGGELIKIGRSRFERLSYRMADLQCMSPVPLRLLRITRGAIVESHLHDRFASDRAHGEWFNATPVRAFLESTAGCIRCSLGLP